MVDRRGFPNNNKTVQVDIIYHHIVHILGNPDPRFQTAPSNFGIPEDSIL